MTDATSNRRLNKATVERFEEQVFRDATEFSAVLFAPRGKRIREDFTTFPDAVATAEKMQDEHGRTGLVYANTTAGRSVCIARDDWPRFMAMWLEKHP